MKALRPLAYLALGCVLPACIAWLAGLLDPGPWTPGPARAWVCDRDAGRLVGLDAALHERASTALVAPVAVAARADGGAWVLDAVERRGGGAHRLARVDPEGRVRADRLLDGPARIAARGEDAIVLTSGFGEKPRLAVVDPEGRLLLERALPVEHGPPTALAVRDFRAVVGFAGGAVLAFDVARDGALLARAMGSGAVSAVAPGPGGGWWVLRAVPPRLALHRASLEPRWVQTLDTEPDGLAPVPGAERAWTVSRADGGALCVGERGRIEARARHPSRGGLRGAAGLASGGALVAAPGAVLELDSSGRVVRSQGGFDFLVALAVVP